MMVFRLHSTANITLVDKLSNLTFHTSLPESFLEIMIHIGAAWMDGKEEIMWFIHYDFSHITHGYHKPVLKEQGVFVIDVISLVLGN